MAHCFALWKQSFAIGQIYCYDLTDLGEHYCDYVGLMDHWHETYPGGIHTVQYEDLVGDTEGQVRALLDYCGLEFEEACLAPHKTDRVVRTISSEQVRKPIYDDAVEHWKHFESHLEPLKAALQPLAGRYKLD